MERFDESFIAWRGIFRLMQSDFRVDDGVCGEANLPVEVDELFDEHGGAGTLRIVFGEPPVADGVVLFLRFVGKSLDGFPHKPCLVEFLLEFAFPADVLGPVFRGGVFFIRWRV